LDLETKRVQKIYEMVVTNKKIYSGEIYTKGIVDYSKFNLSANEYRELNK